MSGDRRPIRRHSGVSLPELLVVIAILALGVTLSVPLIATRVHAVKLQAAVSQYVSVLRAARMIAVSRAAAVTVAVHACPITGGGSTCENSYEYTDTNGAQRSSVLPPGVQFGSESCPTIAFSPSGAAAADCTTVFERAISGQEAERYVVHVPMSGIPRVVHEPPG